MQFSPAVAALSVAVLASTLSAADALVAPSLGDVRLGGLAGESLDTCVRIRAFSDWARGPMYDEILRSFRTHHDDTNGRSGWQNEYWGKTFLCFAGAIDYTRDAGLREWCLNRTYAFLDEFQKPNGYLSTYGKEDFLFGHPENPDPTSHWCFNIWGRKYTLWALTELARVTGDAKCRAAAEKVADHLIAQLDRLNMPIQKTGAWWGISSMSILRPTLELYKMTKKPAYLEFARRIYAGLDAEPANPGTVVRNAFLKKPIREWYPNPTFWAKAYELMSCLEGLVEYYRVTGEARALAAVRAFHDHLVAEELNPMRSVGIFDHFVGGRCQFNGMTELCDVTHWIRVNRELFLLTGEARYADLAEEAFYNAFLAGVSRDGRWGAHAVRSHGTRHWWAPAQTGMYEHQCCPDNMMRTYFDIASMGATLSADGAPSVVFYSDAETTLPGGAKVSVKGGYPWADGPVDVSVVLAKAGKLRFRVPRWTQQAFSVNGKAVAVADGWATVDAPAGASGWRLRFDFSPRFEDISIYPPAIPPSPQVNSADIQKYIVHFMESLTPDMRGLVRSEVGTLILRGPLVLAKGRLAGTTRDETLFATPLRGQYGSVTDAGYPRGSWRAELKRMPTSRVETAGVPAAWRLTLTRGENSFDVPVSDFAHLSNLDDPSNWFSVWF